LTLQTHGHQTLEEVRRFLSGNEAVDFVLSDRVSAYSFIVETLVKFRYRALPPARGACVAGTGCAGVLAGY